MESEGSHTEPADIELRGVTVRFGPVTAVQSLDLDVHAGEVFGFLGPNGAGKTTTLRVLLDLLRPDQGQARILGQEVRAGGGALRAQVGFLPGDLALFGHLTPWQALDLQARLQQHAAPQRGALLERLGFPADAHDRPLRACSTGMRQMVGVVAALQHDPKVLVLDEATTGLDPVVRERVLTLLRERADAGAAVLLSSHVLAEVERTADRVGLLNKGVLRKVGTVAALREARPRQVLLRYAGGREEVYHTMDAPEVLLAGIDRAGLVDVEIRPPNLDELFRTVLEEDA